MVFEETITIECFLGGLTIAINGFTMVFWCCYHRFQWFSMVPDHWSNDAMVSMDRCGLQRIIFHIIHTHHKWLVQLHNIHKESRLNSCLPPTEPYARRIDSNYFCLFLLLSDHYLTTHEVLACSWVSRHWDLLCGWWVGPRPINLLLLQVVRAAWLKVGGCYGEKGLYYESPVSVKMV